MTRVHSPGYQCGDLRICPSLGTIISATGSTVRLGPVNMKVLEALVSRAGTVVSRGELFDLVWKNQIVSEDALTRCVSDIRAELRACSGRDEWIETLPKRGYRWLGNTTELAEAGQADYVKPTDSAPSDAPAADSDTSDSGPWLAKRLLVLVLRGAIYLVVLAAMAVALVWTIDRLAGDSTVIVARLPTTAGAELAGQAAEIDQALMAHLMQIDGIRVLSPSAIESRPSNPFPFFYYEFGARWLVEAELSKLDGATRLTLTVADARTGIAEMQVTGELPAAQSAAAGPPQAFEALTRFMQAESR